MISITLFIDRINEKNTTCIILDLEPVSSYASELHGCSLWSQNPNPITLGCYSIHLLYNMHYTKLKSCDYRVYNANALLSCSFYLIEVEIFIIWGDVLVVSFKTHRFFFRTLWGHSKNQAEGNGRNRECDCDRWPPGCWRRSTREAQRGGSKNLWKVWKHQQWVFCNYHSWGPNHLVRLYIF